MSRPFALFGCVLFILWLFAWDRKRRNVSTALWIPLAWALILGSKPLSVWFGLGRQFETVDDYLEGSPFDRFIFLFLITVGLFVLARRGINWHRFFQNNRWLCIYFLYLGISVLWSDYTFASFKRWIKDAGCIIMVLVILTEERPLEAIKTLLARCVYLLIPMSVLLVKYYPELGRYYDQWTYQPFFCGVSTDKNLFGMSLFIWGVALFWMLLETHSRKTRPWDKTELFTYLLLMMMTVWLLAKARSSTALGCTVLGCAVLLALRFPVIRNKSRRLGAYSFALAVFVVFLYTTLDLGSVFVQIFGRDLTLTGRTEMWETLLKEPINPLIGEGYYSFWMGDRVERLSEEYFYHLNEAHNGYLETYLNSGLIGLFLLIMLFVSAAGNIRREVTLGSNYGSLRLAFLVASLAYGMTEAVFRFGPIWFVLLLMLSEYPSRRKAAVSSQVEHSGECVVEPRTGRGFASSSCSDALV